MREIRSPFMSNHRKKRKTQSKKTHHLKSKYPQKHAPKKTKSKANESKGNFLFKLSETKIISWFTKTAKKYKTIDFSKIKKVFEHIQIKEALLSFIDKSKKYLSDNKKHVLFFSGMTLIVALFYFTVVHPEPEIIKEDNQAEVINLDLADLEMETDLDVQAELSLIQDQEDLVVALEDTPIAPEVEQITAQAVDQGNMSVMAGPETTASSQVEKAYRSVESSIMLGVESYAILVNDEAVAYFETEDEAKALLAALEDLYRDEEAVEERIIFKEDIRIEKVKNNILDFEGYKDFETVLEYIIKGTNEQRIHTVQKGENFWTIAEKYDMNPYDLEDANAHIDPKRLQIGTELSLILPEPIINVVTITKVERIDEVPYGREANVKTDKYYKGEYKTKVAGVPGEAKNTIEVYTENGRLLGEKILDSEIIKEPINMVAYEGTKPVPPSIGTGTFSNPTSRGYITSNFGSRSLGWHNGIDIGIPMRTDVYAADGGQVIFAGYKGTYGKLVMIDHGANKVSYYAHNDSLKVSAGERVFKGQLIALSGNTGRSTGPHLHFEVRINGQPVNPKKFVNY